MLMLQTWCFSAGVIVLWNSIQHMQCTDSMLGTVTIVFELLYIMSVKYFDKFRQTYKIPPTAISHKVTGLPVYVAI